MFILFYLCILNILYEYSSSKKLLDSSLQSCTRVTRHSPNCVYVLFSCNLQKF